MNIKKKSVRDKKQKEVSEKKKEPEEVKKEVEEEKLDKKVLSEEEFDFDGIESLNDLSAVLRFEKDNKNSDNTSVGNSLEGGLVFAPRVKEKDTQEIKKYSDTKYDTNYNESHYGEKTPGYSQKESESDNKNQ